MQPHEIKPDTRLCTILGYNAQRGYTRHYFNKIMKYNSLNVTAIALNITDEHFAFTMQSVNASKVDKMIIESEFQADASQYCDELNEDARERKRVDFIEIVEGRVWGYSIDSEVEHLFEDMKYIDDQTFFIAKMMSIAHRWYDAPIELDTIPLLMIKEKI